MNPSPADQECRDPLMEPQPALKSQLAEARARQAVDQAPGDATAWKQLGQVLEEQGQLGDAVGAYVRATELAPDDVASRTALGYLFRNMSLPEEAIHWHGQALALQPDELILQLNHLFVVPIVASSSQQIDQLRQRCLEGMERLQSRREPWRQGIHLMSHHPYYLIYHNHNDRSLLETYGTLMSSHSQALAGAAWSRDGQPRTPERPKRRIGFLSGHFHDHSNSRAFEGLIRHLDRDAFEVVLIHLFTSRRDATCARLEAMVDQTIVLNQSLALAFRQLDALALDLLYFTDIGMHSFSMLLGCRRSAPVQVTSWGVPQTSGLATIDHYISASLVEPEGAAAHYTENLVQLPGLPCCYLRANLLAPSQDRDYFFLPSDGLLLGCLQTLWKLPPEFDPLLEQIARRVPEAFFVFIEAEITSYTEIFLERIARTAPTLRDRLILLSQVNREEYTSLAASMDLLLDPPFFSSGVSFYETIHTGTPLVCMEGAFLRSRYAAAGYRLMGLSEAPVAQNPEQFVELVVELAGDPQRRQALREEIRQRANAHLYDRIEGVDAFGSFALEAIEASSRQPR